MSNFQRLVTSARNTGATLSQQPAKSTAAQPSEKRIERPPQRDVKNLRGKIIQKAPDKAEPKSSAKIPWITIAVVFLVVALPVTAWSYGMFDFSTDSGPRLEIEAAGATIESVGPDTWSVKGGTAVLVTSKWRKEQTLAIDMVGKGKIPTNTYQDKILGKKQLTLQVNQNYYGELIIRAQ